MADTVIQHTYKLKGGEQEAVERVDPFLERREPIVVFMKDGTTKMKIGDGEHRYSELPFVGGDGSEGEILQFESRLNFPSIGDSTKLYQAVKDCKIYQYNPSTYKYELLNEFKGEVTIEGIEIISGGTALGLIDSL